MSEPNSTIVFPIKFGLSAIGAVLADLRNVANRSRRITLDFSNSSAAFAGPMLALCCEVERLRDEESKSFELRRPTDRKLARLFANTNWEFFLTKSGREQSSRYEHHLPATRFDSAASQGQLVEHAVDLILRATFGLEQRDIAVLEWAIGEITDNALTHAESKQGALFQVSTLSTHRTIEFVVSDSGLSIPRTLGTAYPNQSDQNLLELAIQEGVTRDKSVGQGNGLFGTYEICRETRGALQIRSGSANLYWDPANGLHSKNEDVSLRGTLVVAEINYGRPEVLRNVLKFKGRAYEPIGSIETRFQAESDDFVVPVSNKVDSLFSRSAGKQLRNTLTNLSRMNRPGRRVTVDLRDVVLLSSSFADEAFGKLKVAMGEAQFRRSFRFMYCEENVREIVSRALEQRRSL